LNINYIKLIKDNFFLLLVYGITLCLIACTNIPSERERFDNLSLLIKEYPLEILEIETKKFDLLSVVPQQKNIENLNVYIEGDGLAWISSDQISLNPTPINPISLKLSLADPNKQSAYLARPCQYSYLRSPCSDIYWTSHRFSPEVIESMNEAIDVLKSKFNSKNIILIGYSGGGAISTILAAKRNDVSLLITIAGNLDHKLWTNMHHVDPLSASLNPIEFIEPLLTKKQIHFIGSEDKNIPLIISQEFKKKFNGNSDIKIIYIKNFNHTCCWELIWPDILKNNFYAFKQHPDEIN
jgi:hypothetical protein